MKTSAILLLTAVTVLCVSGKAPDQDNNLISQTKGKFNDYFKTLERGGVDSLLNRFEKEAQQATVDFVWDRIDNFNFNLKDFQLGMFAGVAFGVLEFSFRNIFPTWSWMGYAYKLSLNQSPSTLFVILSKISLELYHQFNIGKLGISLPFEDFSYFDIALSAIAIPVLLLIGDQNYLLGLAFIEFGKEVFLAKHPHFTF